MNSITGMNGDAPSRDDLQALAERLEGLSGRSRETDALIACVLDRHAHSDMRPEKHGWISGRYGGRRTRWHATDYTSRLDRAVELVERLYPLHEIILTKRTAFDGDWWTVELGDGREVEADTAPLAVLRALVAAKIEEGRRANTTLKEEERLS